MRQALFDAQSGCCSICCRPLGPRKGSVIRGGWSFEHVHPRSRYHFIQRGNLLLAHKDCNAAKGNCDPTDAEVELLVKVNRRCGFALELHPDFTGPKPQSKAEKREAYEAAQLRAAEVRAERPDFQAAHDQRKTRIAAEGRERDYILIDTPGSRIKAALDYVIEGMRQAYSRRVRNDD